MPWYTGVPFGAERFKALWHKSQEEASRLNLVYSYVVYPVCDSASELERWAILPFGGFPALTSLLFFSELVSFRNVAFFFFACVGTFSGSFFILFSFRFFAVKSKKEKVLFPLDWGMLRTSRYVQIFL